MVIEVNPSLGLVIDIGGSRTCLDGRSRLPGGLAPGVIPVRRAQHS